jgi:hypothetical protein
LLFRQAGVRGVELETARLEIRLTGRR